jgi:hypothetical protein
MLDILYLFKVIRYAVLSVRLKCELWQCSDDNFVYLYCVKCVVL